MTSHNDLTLYCCCNYDTKVINSDTHLNIKTVPIIGGSFYFSENQKIILNDNFGEKYILDNSLDNISHLNPWFSDLTSIYWVYKNSDSPFIGNRQYGRNFYFIENFNVEENVLYTVSPISFGKNSIETQWKNCEKFISIFDLSKFLRKISLNNRIPVNIDMVNILLESNVFYPDNMFVAENKIYKKYFDLFFEIVFSLWEETKDYCLNGEIQDFIYYQFDKEILDNYKKMKPKEYSMRYLGQSGERINTLILTNFEYFFGNKIKLKTIEKLRY